MVALMNTFFVACRDFLDTPQLVLNSLKLNGHYVSYYNFNHDFYNFITMHRYSEKF